MPAANLSPMTALLRPLAASDSARVRGFLAHHPERDVYLCGLVWRLGVVLPSGAGELLGWFRGGALHGVFLHSAVAVLACEEPEGVDAFAAWTAERIVSAPLHQAISPEGMVAQYQAGLEARGALPVVRLDRVRMPAMRLDRAGLRPREDLREPVGVSIPAHVRNAVEEDRPLVREACREVTREELGVDPEALDPFAFRTALERRVQAGREYIWTDGGRLLFRAALSAATPTCALVEGVYTPAEERGRGYGTAAMHALCERLLRFHDRVVLFVGAENEVAQRLYARLGFEVFGEYRASYFEAPRP